MTTATQGGPHDEVRRALAALEVRLRQAGGTFGGQTGERAEALGAVERELLELAPRVSQLEPDAASDLGHPVLADAARWRDRAAALDLTAPATDASALVRDLIEDEAAAWRAQRDRILRTPTAGACYDALAQATALDREALDLSEGDPPLQG
ncbi:MAG: hypothetical protein ACE5JG_05165, partial [Planctomycetota bacterium]